MIDALIRSAFDSEITCSSAHGASTSTSRSKRSSFEIGSVPGSPPIEPVSRLRANAASTSIPFGLWTPPEESEIATTLAPSCTRKRAR